MAGWRISQDQRSESPSASGLSKWLPLSFRLTDSLFNALFYEALLITLVLTVVSLDKALHSLSHSLAFQWAEALGTGESSVS